MPYRPTHPTVIDPAAQPEPDYDTRGLLAAISAMFMWSTGNIMVRSLDMPGFQIAFWRITLSAVVYWLFVMVGRRRITREQFKASAPAAIVISLEIAIFFVAIKNTTVANATIIGALQPIVLLAVLSRFGERITRWLIGLTLMAFIGVGLVVLGSSTIATWSPWGDFLSAVALLLFSAYFFYAKKARATVPALEFQTSVWIVGSLTLLPLALFDAGGLVFPTGSQWLWLIGLFFIPGTGHFLMNWSHPRLKLSMASMLTLLIPVLSAIGAAIFLNEAITPTQALGMIVVLSALILAIRHNTRMRERTQVRPKA